MKQNCKSLYFFLPGYLKTQLRGFVLSGFSYTVPKPQATGKFQTSTTLDPYNRCGLVV